MTRHIWSCKNFKCAFTLAEVLVTLGIIGVVSAMTLPTLVKNHQRQVYVTQLHKVYNELSQALELYVNDQNAVNLRETPLYNNAAGLRSFVTNYLKVAKDCDTSYRPCFADEYTSIDGSVKNSTANGQCNMIFTLTSGSVICADVANMESTKNEDGEDNDNASIMQQTAILHTEIDINGKQGPNIYGRDYFHLNFDINGNIVAPSSGTDFFREIVDAGWKMEY